MRPNPNCMGKLHPWGRAEVDALATESGGVKIRCGASTVTYQFKTRVARDYAAVRISWGNRGSQALPNKRLVVTVPH